MSEVSTLGDWLVLHEAWRSDVPDELAVGTTVEGIVRVKGMRNRVKWTVVTWDPPRQLALSGVGKAARNTSCISRSAPRPTGRRSVCA